MQNPPGNDQVDHQRSLQAFHRTPRQGFNPAAAFDDAEENFHEPSATAPSDPETRRVQGVHGFMGHQQPLDGLLARRRGLFPCHDYGDIPRLTSAPPQPHPRRAHGLHHRVSRRGRQGKRHLAPGGLTVQLGAQFPAVRQNPIGLHSDQIVRGVLQRCRAIQESPDIALPIHHIDQPGARQPLGQLRHPFVALLPAQTFRHIRFTFWLPRPHPGPSTPNATPLSLTAKVGCTYLPCCRSSLNRPNPAMPGWPVKSNLVVA